MSQHAGAKAPREKKIELHAPPGMRFMNEFGGGVTLQFLEGEEEGLFAYLQEWLDGQRMQHFNAKILAQQPVLSEAEMLAMIAEVNAGTENPPHKETLPPGPADDTGENPAQ